MAKKDLPKIIKRTFNGLLVAGILGAGAYTLATSQIKLEPGQGAIVRELKNIHNEFYNAPRGIINDTDKVKRFRKQPYIPGLEIGSVEEYFDLDEPRKIDGTFAFWSKDKITLDEGEECVRAFNFGCDVDVIKLDSWVEWDPVRTYRRNFSSSEISSREEALSQLIEETFLLGIKDMHGNYEFTEDGFPKFLGLSQQTMVWYNSLLARHDFLIDKLEENGLLEKLNNSDEEGKKEIREFYNDLFEENPWYVLGPLRLAAEGQNMLRIFESSYFSQYPWWTHSMFYNNYSAETKQKAIGFLYAGNPPKDMMGDEENLRKNPEVESRLYREYPKLADLSQKLSDVIKYDTEINSAKVVADMIDSSRRKLDEFKDTIPKGYHGIINLMEKELAQKAFNSSDSSLETLSQILNKGEGEEELRNKLSGMVEDYANAQFQIVQMALMDEGSKVLTEQIKESISSLELSIQEEGKAKSSEILNTYHEFVLSQTNGEFGAKDLPYSVLQESWVAFIKATPYQFEDSNILHYAASHLVLNQQERLSHTIEECVNDLENHKVAQWLYENISKNLQAQNVELKEINELNIAAAMNNFASEYNNPHALGYIAEKLSLNVHEYTMNQDLMEVESMREKELIPFFNEYLLDTREKEMKLWDYALEEILSGNSGIEKYDKSEEEGMDEVRNIRDSYAFKFIEQEAPEYFKEFMGYFNDLPFAENLGVVIKNPYLSVEDELIAPMGIANNEYANVWKVMEKEYKNSEAKEDSEE